MEEKGRSKFSVLKILKQAQKNDLRYKDGRILGSMCTSPHEFAKEVFSMFLESNLGDAGLFQGTEVLEKDSIKMIAHLQGLDWSHGQIVTGGTEANILALWAARNKTGRQKVIAPETAHFSFEKACNLLGLEIVRVKTDRDKRASIIEMEAEADEKTCALVGVAGTTEYGTVDDIEALSNITVEHGIHLHVDAAFGGFVLPFLKELGYSTSYSPDGADSLTVDPHKMGFVPVPCGCVLFKDEATIEMVETKAPYLTKKRQHTIVGTRTGASAASAFAILKLLGREGYRTIVKECMENTFYLYKGISELGIPVRKPTINILAFDGGSKTLEVLTKKGWRLSTTRKGEIRIVVMPHVTKTVIEEFLLDLQETSKL